MHTAADAPIPVEDEAASLQAQIATLQERLQVVLSQNGDSSADVASSGRRKAKGSSSRASKEIFTIKSIEGGGGSADQQAEMQAELDSLPDENDSTSESGRTLPSRASWTDLTSPVHGGRRVRGDSYDGSSNAPQRWTPSYKYGPLVIVSSYTQFDNLAHLPRGTQAKQSVWSYRLNVEDGTLMLLSVLPDVAPGRALMNPAFSRCHPNLNVLYCCTESVKEDGIVAAIRFDGSTGAMVTVGQVGAGGTSTCYLTIDRSAEHMLLVNYWDSTLATVPLDSSGGLGEICSFYDPKEGKAMKAAADSHVDHTRNDPEAQKERQGDPHSHAIVLDPVAGNIAYVPDLGMDLIRQFHYDTATGMLTPCGTCASGTPGATALGPRYISFHNTLSIAYVVNELSSEVAVFSFSVEAAAMIQKAADESLQAQETFEQRKVRFATLPPTLTLIQVVRTLPRAFPGALNTCGRITTHPSGRFVVTSNRGHNSIAVHRVHGHSKPAGMLSIAGIFHTRGETPRHFQFDPSGQWLLVANQDSDTVAVFQFNISTGSLTYTGNEYNVPSPNFVAVVQPAA